MFTSLYLGFFPHIDKGFSEQICAFSDKEKNSISRSSSGAWKLRPPHELYLDYGLRLPVELFDMTTRSEDPGIPGARETKETASYDELIRDDDQPACPIEYMPDLVAASQASSEAVFLPWLTEFKGPGPRRNKVRTVLWLVLSARCAREYVG